MSKQIYSLKMRAAQGEQHISGAEKLVEEAELAAYCTSLLQRALHHGKGKPDFINLKIEAVAPEEILHLPALPVSTRETATPAEGWRAVAGYLRQLGITRVEEILNLWRQSWAMRGAMLLDVDTLQRLEPDQQRGVRATYMDAEAGSGCGLNAKAGKNHFQEALVLATKVVNHPNIVAELCISDDPDYVTGYIAAKELGYLRITTLKQPGSPKGGRIFLFRGSPEERQPCIDYLQKQKVMVDLTGKEGPQ